MAVMNLEEIKKKLETDPIEKLLELKKRRDRFVGKIVGGRRYCGYFRRGCTRNSV